MVKKIKVDNAFVAKPVPAYVPPVSDEKNGIFSKWFSDKVAKYVSYHESTKKLSMFKKWWGIKILAYFIAVFVLLFLCVYSVEDLNNANDTHVWGLWVTILSAIGSIIVLAILFFQTLYSCIFFHKSFDLFINGNDFSNPIILKKYPLHTRKYLYQYGIIDKKVYELIKDKNK